MHEHHETGSPTPFWRSRAGLVAAGFAAVGAFLLLSEHRAHALGLLPYLFLLACPLMHVFMHRGHGHGSHDRHSRPDQGDGNHGHR